MLKNAFFPIVFMTCALLVFALMVVPRALAVTFTVNSTLDQPDDLTMPGTCHTAANTCTLRAAVMQANRTSGAGATIMVPSGIYTLTIPAAGADGEENGDLNLTTPTSAMGNTAITIIGAGAGATIIDANKLDRVFHVHPGRTTTISGVTIRNGFIAGVFALGGGIYNKGSLTVSNAAITGNQSGALGGGISNDGSLTVMNSRINHNKAVSSGGGIRNDGSLAVINSTLSQNNAGYGGGILNGGDLHVSNSTIHDNGADNDGGGIYNVNSLTVVNSTLSQNNANNNGGGIYNIFGTANVYNSSIVFNGADADRDANGGSGGGVYNLLGATFNLRNTLVAGNNVSNTPVYDDCTGTLNSFGRNLFWSPSSCTIINAVNSAFLTLNSLDSLGPLQNNGGPTWTHALLPGSNAIDGGDPGQGCVGPDSLLLATDQRGAARVVGVRCDIGAVEYGALLPLLYLPLISK